jgi:hypothetical protein
MFFSSNWLNNPKSWTDRVNSPQIWKNNLPSITKSVDTPARLISVKLSVEEDPVVSLKTLF